MNRPTVVLSVAVLLVALAACGGSGASVAPTTTAVPTAAAEGSPSSDPGSSPGGEPVDLVLLADSGGWGVAELYAARAAEALGHEIRIHDLSRGGATADDILDGVRHSWSDQVADAEIVVFYVHPVGFEPPSALTCLEALDAIGGDPDYSGPTWAPGQTWDPPEVPSVEDWQGYRNALDRIYDEIWKLRAGRPTILRAYGVYMPWLSQWRTVGIASACVANEEVIEQVRRGAAEAAGAVYVSMLDAFNGPGHDQDPVAKGLIDEDGMHLNDEGVDVLVDALASIGFEVSEPPR